MQPKEGDRVVSAVPGGVTSSSGLVLWHQLRPLGQLDTVLSAGPLWSELHLHGGQKNETQADLFNPRPNMDSMAQS